MVIILISTERVKLIQRQNPVQVILPMWIMSVPQIQLSVLKVQWAI